MHVSHFHVKYKNPNVHDLFPKPRNVALPEVRRKIMNLDFSCSKRNICNFTSYQGLEVCRRATDWNIWTHPFVTLFHPI